MNEEEKRKMTVNYFKKPPGCAFALLAIGVIVFLASANNSIGGGILVGLGLAATGGVMIYNAFGNKPSDQQMDQWLEDDLQMLARKALDRTGTDKADLVADSVQVFGPWFWDQGLASPHHKIGKDNELRYTPVDVTVIHFTQHQLIAYRCMLDRITGKALNENTDEYFYKDVVSVATKTSSIMKTIAGKDEQVRNAETFMLTTSGGTSIEVVLRSDKTASWGGTIPIIRAEKAIQNVRKMLREKKQS